MDPWDLWCLYDFQLLIYKVNDVGIFYVQEKAKTVWDEEGIPCISLTMGASAMHKLR